MAIMMSWVLCMIKMPYSHTITVGHSPDFGLSSDVILP